MELKETKQNFILVVEEEVAPSIEVFEKMKSMLEEFKRVVHDKLPEKLPSMRDIQYHGASILHDFEDPFMGKENVIDESFKFFKFISSSISTWARCIMRGLSSCISNYTLEDHFHGSELIKYGSMVCVCMAE